MSTDRKTTRIVRSWLDDGVTALPDRVLDAVLDQVPATKQRRHLWPSWRSTHMNRFILTAGAVTAVLVVAFVGYNLLPGVGGPGGPHTTSPTPVLSPSTLPTADITPTQVTPLPIALGVPLNPGEYDLASFPVGITLEVVGAGWRACSESTFEQAVCYWPTETESGGQLAFLIVENVVADPCAREGPLLSPPVGPSVDDLVAAISSFEGFEVTEPVDITIDGFSGKEFTVTAPTDTACEGFEAWATPARTTGMGAGEVNVLRVLDVDGVRIMIAASNNPAYADAFQGVLGSVQIEP